MTADNDIPEASRATEIARLELARFAPEATLDRVFARACELCAEVLGVERVGIWLFIDDNAVLRCANLYERAKGEHSAGAILRVEDFPTYFASLTIRKAIPAEVAAADVWTAELGTHYLNPLGITSMLDAGIFVNGVLVGVVCNEHVGTPCEWTTEARDFAGSVADQLAMRIQSAEVRELRAAFRTQRDRVAALDKAAGLAQMAAGIAHDFRSLLTVFLGNGELLCRRAEAGSETHQLASLIVDAAKRGTTMINELLEFARPVQKPPVVLDLAEVTAELMPMLKKVVGGHCELRFSCPASVGQVLIDRGQYTRLLLNLVVNAGEAMPEGGPIDIRLAPVKLAGSTAFTGNFVLLDVTDCGVGISEATRRRVFEPFFSTKDKGTGLGLAIVRQIVDRAGGLIRIESGRERGTTFRVLFPRIGASSGGTSVFVVPPELL